MSLGEPESDAAGLIREWIRTLPSGFKPGSMRPSLLGENIRTLLRLRAQREDATLTDSLMRLLDGPMPGELIELLCPAQRRRSHRSRRGHLPTH
ncbi:hypothetical protein [Streptomyces sp. NPDC056690]|uniref:hypothetical protein n=1 Tax=unclassified Streptomyces TaxID=2593676 RepID=UPI0036390C90